MSKSILEHLQEQEHNEQIHLARRFLTLELRVKLPVLIGLAVDTHKKEQDDFVAFAEKWANERISDWQKQVWGNLYGGVDKSTQTNNYTGFYWKHKP